MDQVILACHHCPARLENGAAGNVHLSARYLSVRWIVIFGGALTDEVFGWIDFDVSVTKVVPS